MVGVPREQLLGAVLPGEKSSAGQYRRSFAAEAGEATGFMITEWGDAGHRQQKGQLLGSARRSCICGVVRICRP